MNKARVPPAAGARAVFLDRDGVLNAQVWHRATRDWGAPWRLRDFRLLPGVAAACRRLRRAGYRLIVVTNQPDVPRGHTTAATVAAVNQGLRALLPLDDIRVCPHDNHHRCACRKPKPGLLLEAARDWRLALADCWMVGDRAKDVEAGEAAGCRTLRIGAGALPDLGAAAGRILAATRRPAK